MKKEQNLKAEETLCRDSDRRNTFPCCDQEGKSRGYARTATVVCVCVCVSASSELVEKTKGTREGRMDGYK